MTTSPMLEIDGMASVEVGHSWDVRRLSIPKGSDVVVGLEAERVSMLSQAVEVRVLRQLSSQPDILRLKDELRSRGVEQDISGAGPRDCKRKWACRVGELQGSSTRVTPIIWWRGQHRFGNLIYLAIRIIDLDMQTTI